MRMPACARTFTRASRLNLPILPRTKSLRRRCDTPNCFALGRPTDDVANARHQLRSGQQVLRFVRREPDVNKYVAAAAGPFQFLGHRFPLFRTKSLNLLRASAKSNLEVLRDFFSKA